MGIGWVVINHEAIEFAASAVLWPSSTKAELMACLTALLVVPVKAQVTIYTDSAATIVGFDKIDDMMNLSVRKRAKIPNYQLWMTIAHLIDVKSLTIRMIKVRAHNGNRLNERADKIAKNAAITAPRLNVNYLSIPGHKLEITCDNLTLKTSSQRCVKNLFDAKHFYHLLQLQRYSDVQVLTEHHHINWSTTSFMLNYNVTEKDKASTSFEQHHRRSFKYKIFSDELPTLYRTRQRRPDLYPSDICLSCQQRTETQAHFWTCPEHQDIWRNILNRAADLLLQILQQNKAKHIPTLDEIRQSLHESRTFIFKGLVSQTLFDFVHSAYRSLNNTDITIAKTYNFIYLQVFNLL